ncbi:class I SAM-dependent methyltransferase [Thalassobaculum sp. OXR-137]|uniref:class I SAM-dependent methyltransferase n=1 Tax=Thalassobaculum sp. OXR-137 TaxID=3100173 RepID=UPI002AC9F0C7|nr:class I SAM-dependent methyltransferase [Thalassobaculum sp. OXR-137]WPZ36187.1 class I SAM-dependent methyltransferase [Thalassobaculum sp. OXR-137]
MSLESKTLENCRLCQGRDLQVLLDLGVMASCGNFPKREEEDLNGPMNLVRCADCGLVQMGYSYHMPVFFGAGYGYRSGLNRTMVNHLHSVVRSVQEVRPLADGDYVLDIGANDGTSLKAYPASANRVGMDPTISTFSEFYPDDILQIADFFSAKNWMERVGDHKAAIVSSIAMFYDIERPVDFAKEIASILASDGVWVFEQSYLPLMLERRSFDTICHEHLEYYTLSQIERILSEAGLRVVAVDLNDINGGSFRITATHVDGPIAEIAPDALAKLRKEDAAFNRNFHAIFDEFRECLDALKKNLLTCFEELAATGKTVHGYGASTKGNTLLQLYGVDAARMPMIADVNERKWGLMTPGTHIPIVSEEESKRHAPDYYMVLPWHFRDGILEREKDFIANGGGFIFPLPQVEIVDQSGCRVIS